MKKSASEFLMNLANPAVSASVSCMDLGCLNAELREVEDSNTAFFHYDVVDGKFNHCFILGDTVYRYLRRHSSLPIELHLAVEEPERYFTVFANYGVDYVAVHYEAMTNPEKCFQLIRDAGALPVLAYRAETAPGDDFVYLARQCAWILKLTVEPGFSGQEIQKGAIGHIRCMKKMLKQNSLFTRIQADGNVNKRTIARLRKAGASIFTGGTSGLFNGEKSVQQNLMELMQAAGYEA